MTQQLLPDLPGFSIEQITLEDGVITLLAQSQTISASCPECTQVSSRVHSRYTRRLTDLPWSGRTVRLVVQVRRFLCPRRACPRKTFAEAIPAIAERYARRTTQLTTLLTAPRDVLWLLGYLLCFPCVSRGHRTCDHTPEYAFVDLSCSCSSLVHL